MLQTQAVEPATLGLLKSLQSRDYLDGFYLVGIIIGMFSLDSTIILISTSLVTILNVFNKYAYSKNMDQDLCFVFSNTPLCD